HLAVEIFASAEDFLKRAPYDGPSCLVLDLHLSGLQGLELQEVLAERNQQIVFLTGEGGVPACVEAMKAGAVDFLTKPVDDEKLLAAVNVALARSVNSRKTSEVRASAHFRLDSLTKRELEVMRLVIAGLLNKQIADELGAAEKTVKIHRGRVMTKMHVSSVADLVRMAEIAGVKPGTSSGQRLIHDGGH
ncbi:MAG: response regulator transcription factor, partial [Verrucomicrobiaceae bacterium]